jgi:glycerophosphoryl diester phosphodiesterase
VHPYLEHQGPIPIAHRGGASEYPENTLAAFQHAANLGYRYIETDVHASKDGVLMAFHDDDLLRTCAVKARISDLTYTEIRSVLVQGKEPIPTLHEVLESFPSSRVNIDCKSDGAVQPLLKLLSNQSIRNRVCIGAFSDQRLNHLRDHFGPSLCTSMGPREVAALRLLPSRKAFRAHAAQVPMATGPVNIVTRRFVEQCHDRKLHIHVWTIDDVDTMMKLLDLGVDGIMTDLPSVLKQVLISRNQWNN